MNRFVKYNLKYNESSLKSLMRIKIINAAFDVVVKHGFKESNIEFIIKNSGVKKRSLYNYYNNIDYLYEDVVMLALNSYYNFDYFNTDNVKTVQEFAYQIGIKYVEHSLANKDLVLYIDFFDSHYNYKYPSHRYDMYLDSLVNQTIKKMKESLNSQGLINSYPKDKFINGIKIMLPALYYCVVKYIRREDRFNNRYSFLTKQGIYELVRLLSLYFQ